MSKPSASLSQYDTMQGLFKVCGYPTATQADMTTWNNLDAKTGLTTPTFDTLLGVMSVGLFQYDITCLQNLCHAQYSHDVNLWCHIITSEFDGWAIGAYIK